MSAMHWEARRRQRVLDRRLATKTKLGDTEERQTKDTAKEVPKATDKPTVSTVNTVTDKRILSQCLPASHARIENRYTSTQYSQQW